MKNQVRELEIKETELKNDIIPYLFIDHIEYCQGLKKHKVYDLDYTDAFCDIRQISTNYSFKDGEYEADLHIEADDTAAIKIFLKNGSSYSMSNINFIDLRSFSKYKDKSNREFYDYDYSYIHIPDAVIVTSQKMVIKPIVILINDKLFEYREIFSKNDESFEYHGELQKRLEISFCNQYGHFYKHNYNICLTKVKSEEQIHFSFRLSDVTYYERMETFQMTRKIAQDRQRNNVQIIDNSPDL